jgi:hypothetical protein
MMKDATKFLVAGCTVYAIMAACGSNAAGGGGPVGTADAQDGTGCGTCTVSGVVRTASADEDAAQALGRSDSVASGEYLELAVGPLFLSDLSLDDDGGWVSVGTVPAAQPCGPFTGHVAQAVGFGTAGGAPTFQSVHGARIFVSADEKLCAFGRGSSPTFRWSGFRPFGT